MTALQVFEKATTWLSQRKLERADVAETRRVGGLWEMLTSDERVDAFNFEGDDTVGRR